MNQYVVVWGCQNNPGQGSHKAYFGIPGSERAPYINGIHEVAMVR